MIVFFFVLITAIRLWFLKWEDTIIGEIEEIDSAISDCELKLVVEIAKINDYSKELG